MIQIKHRRTGVVLLEVDAPNLSGADLRGANLSDADLSGADLSDADLSGANLISAGHDRRGYQFIAVQHKAEPMIEAGCRWLTLTDAKKHWSEAHADDLPLRSECQAIIAHIEAVAIARGWPVKE